MGNCHIKDNIIKSRKQSLNNNINEFKSTSENINSTSNEDTYKEDIESGLIKIDRDYDDFEFQGMLMDIGKPRYERRKATIDKDIRDMISYSRDIGDGVTNIRIGFAGIFSKRNIEDSENYLYEFMLGKLSNSKMNIIAEVFDLSNREESVKESLMSYIKDCGCNINETTKLLGKDNCKFILRSILDKTFEHDMKFVEHLKLYFAKKISLNMLASITVCQFIDYYINRYGSRIAISYISVFYRISISNVNLDKDIAKETLELCGIYDYRTFTKKGMLMPVVAMKFKELKELDTIYNQLIT